MQLTLGRGDSHSVSITDYGAGEVRVGLEGQELIIGYPYEKLSGATLVDKRTAFMRMAKQDLAAATGGFRSILAPGTMVAIPAGFMYLTVVISEGGPGATGLRWSTLDPAMRGACSNALAVITEMTAVTEGLKEDETYKAWIKYLTNMCT